MTLARLLFAPQNQLHRLLFSAPGSAVSSRRTSRTGGSPGLPWLARRLAAKDTRNAQAQWELGTSLVNTGELTSNPTSYCRQALQIAEGLDREGRPAPMDKVVIEVLRQDLARGRSVPRQPRIETQCGRLVIVEQKRLGCESLRALL